MRREGSLWPTEEHCRGDKEERGMRKEERRNNVIKAEHVLALFP